MSKLKTSLHVVILSLAALMAIAASCKKEPSPDATTSKKTHAMAQSDTNILVPMEGPGEPATMLTADQKATITWNWLDWILGNIAINSDSVEYYANRHNIDRITLMPDTTSWQSNNNACTMWTPYHFHLAFDTICKYWDILEQHGKTVDAGNAIIYVNKYNGAQLPNNYELNGCVPLGMSEEDSIRYTSKGYRVMRGDFNYKSGDTKHNINTNHKWTAFVPPFTKNKCSNLIPPRQP